MKRLLPILWFVLCAWGCGNGDAAGDDDDDIFPPIECEEGVEDLVMGRCETADGDECDGKASGAGCDACFGGNWEDEACRQCIKDNEGIHFVPATNQMSLVVGPQGYTMIVFMLRAQDIDGGDALERNRRGNPQVEVNILDRVTGEQKAIFREYTPFIHDPTDTDWMVTAFELWVVTATEVSFDLAGHEMSAIGRVRDQNGEVRCGTHNFQAIRDPRD